MFTNRNISSESSATVPKKFSPKLNREKYLQHEAPNLVTLVIYLLLKMVNSSFLLHAKIFLFTGMMDGYIAVPIVCALHFEQSFFIKWHLWLCCYCNVCRKNTVYTLIISNGLINSLKLQKSGTLYVVDMYSQMKIFWWLAFSIKGKTNNVFFKAYATCIIKESFPSKNNYMSLLQLPPLIICFISRCISPSIREHLKT